MTEKSDSEQIDDIIARDTGWKHDVFTSLRAAIRSGDSDALEVVKYKKPSQPGGVAFWVHNGDICFINVLKNAVRLTFSKGARMSANELFNTRLDSKVVRAIDFGDRAVVDQDAIAALVKSAAALNLEVQR